MLGLIFFFFSAFHRTNLLLYFLSRQLVGHQLIGSNGSLSRPSSVAAGQGGVISGKLSPSTFLLNAIGRAPTEPFLSLSLSLFLGDKVDPDSGSSGRLSREEP